jgi:hypothetical protein
LRDLARSELEQRIARLEGENKGLKSQKHGLAVRLGKEKAKHKPPLKVILTEPPKKPNDKGPHGKSKH